MELSSLLSENIFSRCIMMTSGVLQELCELIQFAEGLYDYQAAFLRVVPVTASFCTISGKQILTKYFSCDLYWNKSEWLQ